jgi:hypothetical protein
MKKPIKDAVDYLVASYQDIVAESKGFKLNPADVQAGLAEAKPDTAEYYVLTLLAQANPTAKTGQSPIVVDVPSVEANIPAQG